MASSVSDRNAPAPVSASLRGRWTRWVQSWRQPSPRPADNPDLVVALWKAAWSNGAQAQWEGVSSGAHANPYASRHERLAWDAGWRWAQLNPDRRDQRVMRMAHRRRRASDSTGHVGRTLGVSALGVSVFLISRALRRWARGAPRQS